jgi:ABC-type transport system involved in multi-copper enzyme maturation permease subunit
MLQRVIGGKRIIMENTLQAPTNSKRKELKPHKLFSLPLLKQSIKAHWLLFVICTAAMCVLICIINIVVGSNSLFTEINMDNANAYMEAEGLDWLKVLGLFQTMGFGLNRLAVMSNLDMTSVLNSIIYTIATIILPMIYLIIVSNSLIAGQVDDGSMAYVLSTPTNRKKVVFTQALFLFGSLIAMYLVVTGFAVLSDWIGYKDRAIPLRTFLLNFGSLCVMLALAGVAFMGSCLFNRSKNAIALGGGFAVWCFLASVLGLFGTKTFVSIGVGVSAMNIFNYMTIISLFNTESIDLFSKWTVGQVDWSISNLNWIYGLVGLILIAIITTNIGMARFQKKDLPL